MTLKTAKEIWDFLKKEYEGDERIKGMQKLNLIREFELQKMKESETVQEYSDKLLRIANKVRLLGGEFADSRIVQKLLVTVLERFETTISALENSKDMSIITLAELLNALQAQEQRMFIKQEGSIKGALQAKLCWKRPDVRCNKCKQLGHIAKICKSKSHQATEAQVADHQEEQLFAANYLLANCSKEMWLVDSACSNHMTSNLELFKELEDVGGMKVKIGNGDYMEVKGRGTIALEIS
ncbi:uncharacterized protein LOC127807530 [Diospyros lotus]|uniref:uncharacterized protein LOC127807530 n=1 Tax=Diospyros lotus TaxID=55363 RepID=UPI0022586F20|nr:uncharacterized protein LOC127807530 [Diospyros lotus]